MEEEDKTLATPPPLKRKYVRRTHPAINDEQLEAHAEAVKDSAIPETATVEAAPTPPPLTTDWTGKDVILCTPWYRQVNQLTAVAIAAAMGKFGSDKIGWAFCWGDAMIYKSRNKVAEKFMQSGAPWSIWIDDDMIPPFERPAFVRESCGIDASFPDKYLNDMFVTRLLSHQKTLVGSFYVGRTEKGTLQAWPLNTDGQRTIVSPGDELAEMDWVGTGLMLVHRQVFLDIQKKYPELAPGLKKGIRIGQNGEPEEYTFEQPVWDYFLPGHGQGEDVAFCRRARASGHKVYLDKGLRPFHVGAQAWNYHNVKP